MREMDRIVVRSLSPSATVGTLCHGALWFRCALGRAGIKARKREGDGATPLGTFALLEVLYRRDRIAPPRTALPTRAIAPNDGWCDAVDDRNYNRPVVLPYPASAENLWRDDHLYDIVVVLDHNNAPRRAGLGSCIFMHVARPGYTPTAGCIALARADLMKLLRSVPRHVDVEIGGVWESATSPLQRTRRGLR